MIPSPTILPVRSLTLVCALGTLVALAGCDSTPTGRPKSTKSSREQRDAPAKSPAQWSMMGDSPDGMEDVTVELNIEEGAGPGGSDVIVERRTIRRIAMHGGADSAQPVPGYPMPGHLMPAQPMPSHPMPGHPMPGYPMPGPLMPAQPMPSHPMPSHPMPGHLMPAQPMPSHPMPGHGGPNHPGDIPPGAWMPVEGEMMMAVVPGPDAAPGMNGTHPAMGSDAMAAPKPVHPPVMLGVRMRELDPVLATHLGLDPHRCAVLEDVSEELSGHAGGLRDHDIIVAVDGSDFASPSHIRAVLRMKKPGDTIVLKGRRANNQTFEATITLESFDHAKLLSVTPARVGG